MGQGSETRSGAALQRQLDHHHHRRSLILSLRRGGFDDVRSVRAHAPGSIIINNRGTFSAGGWLPDGYLWGGAAAARESFGRGEKLRAFSVQIVALGASKKNSLSIVAWDFLELRAPENLGYWSGEEGTKKLFQSELSLSVNITNWITTRSVSSAQRTSFVEKKLEYHDAKWLDRTKKRSFLVGNGKERRSHHLSKGIWMRIDDELRADWMCNVTIWHRLLEKYNASVGTLGNEAWNLLLFQNYRAKNARRNNGSRSGDLKDQK